MKAVFFLAFLFPFSAAANGEHHDYLDAAIELARVNLDENFFQFHFSFDFSGSQSDASSEISTDGSPFAEFGAHANLGFQISSFLVGVSSGWQYQLQNESAQNFHFQSSRIVPLSAFLGLEIWGMLLYGHYQILGEHKLINDSTNEEIVLKTPEAWRISLYFLRIYNSDLGLYYENVAFSEKDTLSASGLASQTEWQSVGLRLQWRF